MPRPPDYAYNAAITDEVARMAHVVEASVEGELGCLGSLETKPGKAEDGHGFERSLDHSMLLTDSDEAERFAAEFRRIAVTRPDEFDPRKFLNPAMDAMASICRARFEAFDTAGHAAAIKVIPIADMAKRYASGALDPRVSKGVAA